MANETYSHVDELFTRLVDSDQQWGPLLFLRPARHVPFRTARVLALSVLVGGGFGLPGSIFLLLLSRSVHRAPLPVYAFPLLLTVLYFALCQLSFVPAWNRRALRLAKPGLSRA
jgi:hypothetical protein